MKRLQASAAQQTRTLTQVPICLHAHQQRTSLRASAVRTTFQPFTSQPPAGRRRLQSTGRTGRSRALSTPVMAAATGPHDLLVVGPGVLGGYAGKLWREAFPGSTVIGVTNTANNHERIAKLGLKPTLKADLPSGVKYPYVLFSAPPSGAADYAAELSAALALWDSSAPNSSFVFTSSMGVCSVDDGSSVDENCPVYAKGASPSQDKILAAEEQVFKAGGNVLRLVGLYHANRGAHPYFLRIQQVPRPGDYVVNLIHYEDAADMAVKVLQGAGSGPFRGKLFLGCDNNPISFRDMIDACLKSPLFSDKSPVTWGVPDGGPSKGKRANNDKSRQLLGGWTPKYSSFKEFMTTHGKDFYTTSGLF